jgi:hypothetical protein
MNACAPESGFGAGGASTAGAFTAVVSQIPKFTEMLMVVSMPGITPIG